MLSSRLLVAFCSLVVLASALPRDQISFGFRYPYQVISNNADSSDLKTVPTRSAGEAVTTSQQPSSREDVDRPSICNEPDSLFQDNFPLSIKVDPTESVPAPFPLGKAGSDAPSGPEESAPAPIDPAPAKSLPCIGPWCKGLLELIDTCNKGAFNRRITVPIDHCFNTPNPYGTVMITKPAICPDGTYAKLAAYEDQGCRSMLINTQLDETYTDVCLNQYGSRWGVGTIMPSLKPLCKDSPEYNISLARNASINLFAASTKPIQTINEGGCSGAFNSLSLPANTCLSGDYYISYNMIITQAPICANGQHPLLFYYNARGCVGKIRYLAGWGSFGPSTCLWPLNFFLQARYWSIIWRCGYFPYPYPQPQPVPQGPQGAKFHQAAVAPPAPCPDAPRSAVVSPCSLCNGSDVSRKEIIILPTGNCLVTPGDGIEILSHGVCENGTRAQWARFEDENCGGGTISSRYGLVDIPDRYQPPDVYLDKCLSTGIEDGEKIGSVAFWCDGLRSGDKDYEGDTPSEPYNSPLANTHHLDM